MRSRRPVQIGTLALMAFLWALTASAVIEPASAEMKKLGKTYEFEISEGAGHGVLRAQGDRGGANYRASEKSWPRVLAFLEKYTK